MGKYPSRREKRLKIFEKNIRTKLNCSKCQKTKIQNEIYDNEINDNAHFSNGSGCQNQILSFSKYF